MFYASDCCGNRFAIMPLMNRIYIFGCFAQMPFDVGFAAALWRNQVMRKIPGLHTICISVVERVSRSGFKGC